MYKVDRNMKKIHIHNTEAQIFLSNTKQNLTNINMISKMFVMENNNIQTSDDYIQTQFYQY